MTTSAAAPDRGAVGRRQTMPWRGRRRRLWFGLLTVLGLAERGYFIPHRYTKTRGGADERPAYPAIETLFAGKRAEFQAVLNLLDDYEAEMSRIGAAPAPQPRWNQAWFPRLDAAVAYALVRKHAPRCIVEIGSGHSTRFFARAVADGGLATRIGAIDPAPRAAIEGLPVEFYRTTLQALFSAGDTAPFETLRAGDILAIDSSHILMPGSDVDILLGRVLPSLPPGVLVHIHDVFLPDDYPAEWDWRGYNEQLGILPLLLGGRFEVMFASRYVATRMAAAFEASVAARLPLGPRAPDSSLWLRSLAGAA